MKHTMCELFAGIGGFRIAFNHITLTDNNVQEEPLWDIVYANQWEPKTNLQSAFKCYQRRFGKKDIHTNKDINKINPKDIPKHTVLTAGFPCQDFSIANSNQPDGIKGDKGSLLSTLLDIIQVQKPPFILLENVDRLLKSPSRQVGRDFAYLLKRLSDNNYIIEWRVINASDYGFPQRRRRIFIFATQIDTKYAKTYSNTNYEDLFFDDGFFARPFPIQDINKELLSEINLQQYTLDDIVNNFTGIFYKAGYCIDGQVLSTEIVPEYVYPTELEELLDNASDKFNLNDKRLQTIKQNKGAKSVQRINEYTQECYTYSEGSVSFPDDISMPARTLTTYEGTVNRSAHVIEDPITKQYRFLTPNECEKIQMIPENWTNMLSNRQRYFVIGNSLVINVVRLMGDALYNIIQNED